MRIARGMEWHGTNEWIFLFFLFSLLVSEKYPIVFGIKLHRCCNKPFKNALPPKTFHFWLFQLSELESLGFALFYFFLNFTKLTTIPAAPPHNQPDTTVSLFQ